MEAGKKLKEAGTSHWGNFGDNNSGFTALQGGCRGPDSKFLGLGGNGLWWSATGGDATGAWFRYLSHDNASVDRSSSYESLGLSVRCVKD